MKARADRRTVIASLGAGLAGVTAFTLATPRAATAAHSSAAGVVAGGSLEGPNGTVQFSAFGSRLEFDGATTEFLGALAWHDSAGADGEPLVIRLATVASYGPGPAQGERVMSGTVTVNGEGAHPFALQMVDRAEAGEPGDSVRLAVGPAAGEITGTPVAAGAADAFAYDVAADLATGDVQVITFT